MRTIDLNGAELHEKRFYLPGVLIERTCPVCSQSQAFDGNGEHVSYPTVGEPQRINFYCAHYGTKHKNAKPWEAQLTVVIRMSVEVPEQPARGEQS